MRIPKIRYITGLTPSDQGVFAAIKDEKNANRELFNSINNTVQHIHQTKTRMQIDEADFSMVKEQSRFQIDHAGRQFYSGEEIENLQLEGFDTFEENENGDIVPKERIPAYEVQPAMFKQNTDRRIQRLSKGIGDTVLRNEWIAQQEKNAIVDLAAVTQRSAQKQIAEDVAIQLNEYNQAMDSGDFEFAANISSTMRNVPQSKRDDLTFRAQHSNEVESYNNMMLREDIESMSKAESFLRSDKDYNATDGLFSDETRLKIADQLSNRVKSLKAKTQRQDLVFLNERINERRSSIENGLSEAEANFIEDPIKRKAAKKQINMANVAAQIQTKTKLTTPEEDFSIQNKLTNAINTPGNFTEELDAFNVFNQVMERKRKAIEVDPAGYVNTHDSAVSDKYENYKRELISANQSGELERPEVKEALANLREDYVAEQKIAQSKLGVWNEDIRYISKPDMEEIKINMNNLPLEQQAQFIQQTAQQWGKNWGEVYRQMVNDKVLSGDMVVVGANLGSTDTVPVTNLISGLRKGKDKLFEINNLSGVEKTDFKNVVTALTSDFENSISATIGDDPAPILNLRSAIETLALENMQKTGVSSSIAIVDATNDLLLKHYQEDMENFRVPINAPIQVDDAVNISDKLRKGDGVSFGLTLYEDFKIIPLALGRDMNIPEVRNAAKEETISILKEQGIWNTTPNEDGLMLYYPDGSPALTENGGFVRYTWDELEAMKQNEEQPEFLKQDFRL